MDNNYSTSNGDSVKFLFLIFVSSSYLWAALPTPKGVRKDVKFWEKVFNKYQSNECVFHDNWNLDVNYGILKLPRRKQNRAIKRKTNKIKAALRKLAKKKRMRTKFEKQVLAGIPKRLRTKKFYRGAIKRIRCQRGVATDFKKSLKRSKKHLKMIRRELKRHGLPRDLAYLPHLESGFNNKAHSKVGARGLWQFMKTTAREGGLKVNLWRDERLNVKKSTRLAVKTLKRNYQKAKSWPLAVTGYNYGINGILRGIKRTGTRKFDRFRRRHKSPIFKFAARNFYPSFLAVRNLAERSGTKKSSVKKRKKTKKKSSKKATKGLFFSRA